MLIKVSGCSPRHKSDVALNCTGILDKKNPPLQGLQKDLNNWSNWNDWEGCYDSNWNLLKCKDSRKGLGSSYSRIGN